MRLAAAAAPNPLSMLTTVTPDAQEFSIASKAARPPNEAPYPTLVGTAITGTFTKPPTTPGSAPSIPAPSVIALVAGMEGAPPSVVGGLGKVPVMAARTSV